MKKITVNKTRILTAAVTLLAAVCCLAGCGTSRAEEATPETAAPEATATPAPRRSRRPLWSCPPA